MFLIIILFPISGFIGMFGYFTIKFFIPIFDKLNDFYIIFLSVIVGYAELIIALKILYFIGSFI